jgi:hypothetical protein
MLLNISKETSIPIGIKEIQDLFTSKNLFLLMENFKMVLIQQGEDFLHFVIFQSNMGLDYTDCIGDCNKFRLHISITAILLVLFYYNSLFILYDK